MRVKISGFKRYKDRHGKLRCYHRNSGTPIDLEKYPFGSAEFLGECERIALRNQIIPARNGSLKVLVTEYRRSPAFTELAESTQKDYLKVFDYLQPLMQLDVKDFTRTSIVQIRDKAMEKHKRRFANYVRQVFSLLFSWGIERGYLDSNPAKGIKSIKRPKDMQRANRPWTDTERFVVLDDLDWHLRIPIALCMFLALTETDALEVPKDAYDGSVISGKRGKTGVPYHWPVPIALKRLLDDAPRHSSATLAANSHGKSWTASGLRASWRKEKLRLEAEGKIGPGLTIHGLRHTMANRLIEEGRDDRTVADALQQKTTVMARHYSEGANMRKKMEGVTKTIDESEERRRDLSNLSQKVSNPIDAA